MLIELHIALFTDTYNMMFSSYDMNIICNEYGIKNMRIKNWIEMLLIFIINFYYLFLLLIFIN